MRTDEEMLHAAQANALIGGLVDAVALEKGGLAPQVADIVVVWTDRREDDEASMMAFNGDGEVSLTRQTVSMLSGAVFAALDALGGRDDEPTDES
jgi:hypothetical protein